MSFRVDAITLYPEAFPGSLGLSLSGKALESGLLSVEVCDLRSFGRGRHRAVDAKPAGGGPGMVLRPDSLADAIDSVSPPDDSRPRILMSPRGKPFSQALAREFAEGSGLVIVCGRFEGVDERVIKARGLTEISIGDYVLSGGESACLVVLEAVARLLPGAMGNEASTQSESFEDGLLEHPQYAKPVEWEGRRIPSILSSGDHGAVEAWRRERSIALTGARRPDLLKKR